MKMRLNRNILLVIVLMLLGVGQAATTKIKKITFRGVRFHGPEDLENIIASHEGERFDRRLVRLDKLLMTNYYKANGFFDVSISDSVVYLQKRKFVNIYYTVQEGQRYYYGGVRFKGNKDISAAQLAEPFKNIKLYSPFDEVKITDAVKQVENIYYNSGKPFVDLDVKYLYEQDSLIVVMLDIQEHQTVYIKEIRYYGLKQVQRFIVRRELEIRHGDRYSREKLEASQKNIYGTGLFKYVSFDVEPIPGDPNQAVLKILVQEKPARWIGVRVGVAHEQEAYFGSKFEMTLQGGHRNLFGTARSISFHITPSLIYDINGRKIYNPDNKISLRFVEPWIFYTRTPGVLQLLYEQFRPPNSGHFDLWRAKFDVKRKMGSSLEIMGSLDMKLVNLVSSGPIDSAYAAQIEADKSQVYSLILYGKRDKRKNLFNPEDGSFTDVSLSYSYSQGRDAQNQLQTNNYFIVSASWQRYQPWRPKIGSWKRMHFTLASRLKMGAILEPGKPGVIPINDRFYAGGATSVRGYHEQLLGPAARKDAKGKIVQAAGGKVLFLGNIEARIPLFWVLVFETFIDAGYVWPEVNAVKLSDIKVTSGAGLVALTPLGPVRLDYGYKWMPAPQDPTRDAWHIGIYFAF